MRRPALALALVLTAAACSDAAAPAPAITSPSSSALERASAGEQRVVSMMDACDPTTFAAQNIQCLRDGGVSFQQFIAQLEQHGEAGAWHFAPPELNVKEGQVLLAMNRGGEVHTFTEVEHFGGGIVPDLNRLSGNLQPAPECLALEPDDFVQPGGRYSEAVEEEGTELYQCCIHPWMRTVVHAHHG